MANTWGTGSTIIDRAGSSAKVDAQGFLVDDRGGATYGGNNGGIRSVGSDGTVYSAGDAFGYVDDKGLIRSGSRASAPMTPAPSAPVATAAPATLPTPTQWAVTPNQTVQTQLDDILAKDGLLMQRARAQSNERMSGSGTLHSSMAAGAAEAAMIDAAMPIATADAATYNKSAGYNADQQNQANVFNANSQNSASQFNAGAQNYQTALNQTEANRLAIANATAANDMARQQLDVQSRMQIANTSEANRMAIQKSSEANDLVKQQYLSQMDAQTRTEVANISGNYQQLAQASSSAASFQQNMIQQIAQIQTNANLDANAKSAAISNLMQLYDQGMQTQSAISNLNLPSLLDFTVTTPASNTPAPATAPATPAPAWFMPTGRRGPAD